jgi:hypothetical protein
MCKEMPVIRVNKVADPKRIIGKKWRPPPQKKNREPDFDSFDFFQLCENVSRPVCVNNTVRNCAPKAERVCRDVTVVVNMTAFKVQILF